MSRLSGPQVDGLVVIVGPYNQKDVFSHCPQGWPRTQCQVTLVHVVSLVVLVGLIRLHCQAILGIVEDALAFLCAVCKGVFLVSAQGLGLPSMLLQCGEV